MPADIVNLRRARKAKTRADRDKQATENRLVHGRSKAEKTAIKSETDTALRRLDDHRRETEDS